MIVFSVEIISKRFARNHLLVSSNLIAPSLAMVLELCHAFAAPYVCFVLGFWTASFHGFPKKDDADRQIDSLYFETMYIKAKKLVGLFVLKN